MQARAVFVLLLAITLGALAVVLVNAALRSAVVEEIRVDAPLPMDDVVIARVALPIGTRLSAEQLMLRSMPEGMAPEGSFSSIGEALGQAEQPRVAIREIFPGEIVTLARLSPPGARAGLAVRIPEDMRAVTIATDEVQGVAGFVLPGDRVDVLHTMSSAGTRDGELVTRSLLQNVEVVAVDQLANEDREDPRIARAITLLLDIEQAQKVTLAQRVGQVKLALRNTHPPLEEAIPRPLRAADLYRGAPPAAPVRQTAAAPGMPVEVIRGLQVGAQRVPPEAPARPVSVSAP